ncbi:hypothetical protein PM082_019752 [Marasmius tenuissimus]|nr:hypothetical protein PM082_019752 [Marasmius tenuissimus]
MNFPIVIEEIDENDPSSAPKIEKISVEQVDRIIELVQEFSQSKKCDQFRSNTEPLGSQKDEYDYSHYEDQLRAANLANAEADFGDLPGNGSYTGEDIAKLRARWLHQNSDILGGVPEELPSFRAINHQIQLVD